MHPNLPRPQPAPAQSYHFQCELWLPQPRETVYRFFADARNLQALTPSWLHFEILTPSPILMQPGAIIDYRLRIHGFFLRWRTEITTWEPPTRFVDKQIRGPYHSWEHTHTFHEQAGGTLCVDEVNYWPRGGAIANCLFVQRDIKKIFAFRQTQLRDHFRAPVATLTPG